MKARRCWQVLDNPPRAAVASSAQWKIKLPASPPTRLPGSPSGTPCMLTAWQHRPPAERVARAPEPLRVVQPCADARLLCERRNTGDAKNVQTCTPPGRVVGPSRHIGCAPRAMAPQLARTDRLAQSPPSRIVPPLVSGVRGIVRSLWMYYGSPAHLRRMRTLYAQFIHAGDLAFDVGAHVGSRTLVYALLGARVVAVEPVPQALLVLRLIYGRHPRITLVPAAVGAG